MKWCFHHDDLDGEVSGAIVKMYDSEVELVSVDYRSFPIEKVSEGDTVYLVDYTPKKEVMRKLVEMASVVWIDHHVKTYEALSEFEGLDGIRSGDRCGAVLTWLYLFSTPIPWFLREIVEKWDMWTHDGDSDVLNFVIAYKQFRNEPNFFENLIKDYFPFGDVIKAGEYINEFVKNENESNVGSYGYEIEVVGKKALVLNGTRGSSLVFGEKLKEYDLCIVWNYDGVNYIHHLYTANGVDVEEIARRNGGGGHFNKEKGTGAAGFVNKHLGVM